MKKYAIFSIALTLLGLTTPLFGGKSIQSKVQDIPAIGMITSKVAFDGITLSGLEIDAKNSDRAITCGKQYVVTKPNKRFRFNVNYEIDADVLANLDMHHFIYGLHDDQPQSCLLHSFGVSNRSGKATFDVRAPKQPGVYQLRFCHAKGYGSFESVKDSWNQSGKATSDTIMAIVIVSDS